MTKREAESNLKELIEKFDIYGKLENLEIIATFFNKSAEICSYLENKCSLGMGISIFLSFIISFFIVLWIKFKYIIIIILAISLIVWVFKYIEKRSEQKGYEKKIKSRLSADPNGRKNK